MTQTQSNKTKQTLLVVVAALSVITVGLLAFHLYRTLFSDPPQEHNTRILTWLGYFDDQSKIRELEAKCDTRLEITEYLHANGLRDSAASSPYDLYIYPWSTHIYSDDDLHLNRVGPKINEVVKDYHSAIRQKYYQLNIPDDTVYFQHGVQMFVYDQSQIPELNSLTAEGIIQLSYTNAGKVFLRDELSLMDWLIKQIKTGTPEENWIRLYQQFRKHQSSDAVDRSGLHFSNFATGVLDDNLILGSLFSGGLVNPNFDWAAVAKQSQAKSLTFGLHPSLSYVGSDVLTLKSHDSRDQCVAKTMASRSFLKWVAERHFRFSPFEERIESLPSSLQRLTQAFYESADKLRWLDEEETADDDSLSVQAEMIWEILKACEDGTGCEGWMAIGDKAFASNP